MNDSLSAVWQQVTDFLTAGVSIIPVRDREQKGKPPKTPYYEWKQFQKRIISPEELWHAMEEYETTAVAIICGEVSGNLEAIDIDVKNWGGIDARLFEAIREIYPDLFQRLRIHATPSGGYHILYRVDRPTGIGNLKLATAANSTQAGLETRGEGGYIVAPPSLGYRVYQDRSIPVITADQRESLINLARSFNEKVKIAPPPAATKQEEQYYDENPFVHYNRSLEAGSVLLDYAWTDAGGNNHYRYFTRPGKSAGISASFNRSTRLFYVFTSGTSLEPERGYHPATVLAELRFAGDKRATYRWLVEQGYGKIKHGIERSLVQRKAIAGESLPPNASAEAKVRYLDVRRTLEQRYQHGVFWIESDKGPPQINRERLYHVSGQLGYRLYHGRLVCIKGHTVEDVPSRTYYDHCKAYIGAEEAVCNAFESFVQKAGEFTIGRLPLLEEDRLLRSTKHMSYRFYTNQYLCISATEITCHAYSELAGRLIWANQVTNRPFQLLDTIDPQGLYYEFLSLAVSISTYLWQVIGYLCHDYKDEATGYIIVLIEQCPDPKKGGGTGKNIFTNLIGQATTLKNMAGVQVQFNENFLQVWNYERVLSISDIPKRFNFSFLKELSTGNGTLKKLFHDQVSVPSVDMPKLILSSNYSYDASDGGLARRLVPLEFSPFFTRAGGVDVHFGKLFPYDWGRADWGQFDNIIVRSIQQYLLGGGKLHPMALTEDGWLKQFDQMHMQLTREFIQQQWDNWLGLKFVSHELFREQYGKFCIANNVGYKYQLSSMRMTQALEDWCTHYKIRFTRDHTVREMLEVKRGRLFEYDPAPF